MRQELLHVPRSFRLPSRVAGARGQLPYVDNESEGQRTRPPGARFPGWPRHNGRSLRSLAGRWLVAA